MIANNKFYHNLEISEERLNALPEDNVPEELLAITRQESSPDLAEREREGYVPEDDSDDEEMEEDLEFLRSVLGAYADREGESTAQVIVEYGR